MIREAADNGYDSISWTKSGTQADRWSEDFIKLYRLVYDEKMVAEANRIGSKGNSEVRTITLDTDDGPVEVWNLELTPRIKYKAKFEGFPLFQMLGAGAGAAFGAQQLEDVQNDQRL
jgi:hypothetical protein